MGCRVSPHRVCRSPSTTGKGQKNNKTNNGEPNMANRLRVGSDGATELTYNKLPEEPPGNPKDCRE